MSSFAILGAFTSSTGVMLPQIEAFYNLNDVQASACFLAGPFGYVLAAQFNHTIHNLYGRRGIAIFGPMAQCIAAVGIALHPPFPLVLACITLAFSGAGLLDGSWCSWAARQNRANLISGLLHGSFSFGAGCGPVLIELVLAEKGMWYTWYKLLVSDSSKFSNRCATVKPQAIRSLTEESGMRLYN
jgi:fucose permease